MHLAECDYGSILGRALRRTVTGFTVMGPESGCCKKKEQGNTCPNQGEMIKWRNDKIKR